MGKLALRFVGLILERVRKVAYRVKFPDKIAGVHDVFYVSH